MLLVSTLWASASLGQEPGPATPIPPKLVRFLQEEFNSVPAAAVAAGIPHSTCRQQQLPKMSGAAPIHLYLCDVDLGCNVVQQVPVFALPDGTLGFAPDTPEQVVFYACPESISDPLRRATIARELQLPVPKFTKIK